jgi:hypothetical protein
LAAAAALFVVALSNSVYEATSPSWLNWHVLLRKTYSVAAFAVVAYLLRKALVENGRPAGPLVCILATAAYSAAIEVGQAFVGSHEGLLWNAIDVGCGALGGAIASAGAFFMRGRVRG